MLARLSQKLSISHFYEPTIKLKEKNSMDSGLDMEMDIISEENGSENVTDALESKNSADSSLDNQESITGLPEPVALSETGSIEPRLDMQEEMAEMPEPDKLAKKDSTDPNMDMQGEIAGFPEPVKSPKKDSIASNLDMQGEMTELNEGHKDIAQRLQELKLLSKKRDEDLKLIRKTIKECKDKVQSLRQPPQRTWTQLARQLISMDLGMDKLQHTGSVKFLGALAILVYLLTLNVHTVITPNLPSLYGYLHLASVIFHLAFITGQPLHALRQNAVGQMLPSATRPPYEDRVIGAIISTISLLLIKLKSCCPGQSCGSCIQMLLSTAAYTMETHDVCYYDFVDSLIAANNGTGSEGGYTFTKHLPLVLMLSIGAFFLLN